MKGLRGGEGGGVSSKFIYVHLSAQIAGQQLTAPSSRSMVSYRLAPRKR